MSIESPWESTFLKSDGMHPIFPYYGDFSEMARDPRYRAEKNISGESFSSTFFPFADFPLFLSGKLWLSGTELSLRYPGPQRASQILHTPTALYNGLRAEAVLKPNQASIGGNYPWKAPAIEQGDITTMTAGGNIDLMRDPALRLDALSIQHSILRFLDPETPVPERKKWLEQFGIHIPESDLADAEILRQAMLSFSLGNLWMFDKKDGDTDGLFLKMGMMIRGDQVIVNESGTKLLLWATVGIGGDVFRGVETFLPSATVSWVIDQGKMDMGAKVLLGVDSFLRLTSRYTIPREHGGGHRMGVSAGIDTNIGAFAGAKYDRIGATGKWVGIGFELGNHGWRLILSRSNLLAGTPSVSRNFGTSGVRAEISYAPGFHVIDETGGIFWLQWRVFQFFGRTPELESALGRILPQLEKLKQSGHHVVIQDDFLKELGRPEMLQRFVIFLERQSEFFASKDFPLDNIIFSKDNASGSPLESDFRRSQLRVTPLGFDADIRSFVSLPLEAPSGETRIETNQTKKYGIRIHMMNPMDPSVSEGIDRWIELAVSRGEIEHLRGKHVLITRENLEKREQFIFDHITASGQYQEITIPIAVITEIGQKFMPKIDPTDSEKTSDVRAWFGCFVDAKDMLLVPQIRVVPDSDMSLRDPHADIPTQKRYSAENGVLCVSTSYMKELQETFRNADMKNLSWYERLQKRSVEQMILASRLREIEYIEKYSEVLQSSREAQRALSQEIAGTTLYEVIPTKKNADGMEFFLVRETASKQDVGTFGCRLDATNQVHLEIDHDMYLFRMVDDPEAKRLFSRFPWLRVHLFGTSGVNPIAGKKVYLSGIIARLARSHENSKN